MLVIAKAYGDEPLVRLLTGCQSGLVYVINPALAEDRDIVEFSGVGFPEDSVFQHSPDVADLLSRAWADGDLAALSRYWAEATPLTVRA